MINTSAEPYLASLGWVTLNCADNTVSCASEVNATWTGRFMAAFTSRAEDTLPFGPKQRCFDPNKVTKCGNFTLIGNT